MTTMDEHTGIMLGCLTCRFCIYFHKKKKFKAHKFQCEKSGNTVAKKDLDKFQCEYFRLKKYVTCPIRDNQTTLCNDCLWDYHTLKDSCQNCVTFASKSNARLKLKKSKKTQIKKKPKLKLKKKPKLKLKKKPKLKLKK